MGLQGFVFGGFVFAAAGGSGATEGDCAVSSKAAGGSPRQRTWPEESPARVEAHFEEERESSVPSTKERVGSKGTLEYEHPLCDWTGSMSLHGIDLDGKSEFTLDDAEVRKMPSQCSINVVRRTLSGASGFAAISRDLGQADKFVGQWACVDTWGMDEFLRGMGVGKVKRMAASAAPWPSWDFEEEDGALVWVNHSALGDLIEEIQVNGEEYEVVDGKKQRLKCRASWEGGALVIDRDGPQGRFREERSVGPDGKLQFVLRNLEERLEATAWGRTFEKRLPL